METKRIHARIYGRVQGVFFRASTRDQARELGLSGWVRNMPDGTVEIEAEGDKKQVDKLLTWLWQGPPNARVTAVETMELTAKNDRSGFHVIY